MACQTHGGEVVTASKMREFGFTFPNEQFDDETPLMAGSMIHHGLKPGLSVFLSRARILRDNISDLAMQPTLLFGLMFHGVRTTSCKGVEYRAMAGSCYQLSLQEPTSWRTRSLAGEEAMVASLVIDRDWLESLLEQEFHSKGDFIKNLAHSHLKLEMHQATDTMQLAVNRLVHASHDPGQIGQLRFEAAALDYAVAWLEAIADIERQANEALHGAGQYRIREVRERLDALRPEESLTLEMLAGEFNMSTSTLCRHFRKIHGTSVCQYLAERRLQLSRAALEREGATIKQAAFLAGYANASSFSTAFKRMFGVAPSELASHDASEQKTDAQ